MAVFSISTKRVGRPEGYQYPIGLTTKSVSGGTANVAADSSGGVQTTVGSNAVHTYTSSGTFSNDSSITYSFSYMFVAGGGGGGQAGGGGGAGGLVLGSGYPVIPGADLIVTLGSAGAGSTVQGTKGANGTNTTVTINSNTPSLNLTAEGGGGGTGNLSTPGNAGGSGGGGGLGIPAQCKVAGPTSLSPAGTQGYPGGAGAPLSAGGGGGAGAAGAAGVTPGAGGAGGVGVAISFTGSPVYYGGGGGGGTHPGNSPAGAGGNGGGAAGGDRAAATVVGTANRGRGGGGGCHVSNAGGGRSGTAGGSGFAQITYVMEQTATTLTYDIGGANGGPA